MAVSVTSNAEGFRGEWARDTFHNGERERWDAGLPSQSALLVYMILCLVSPRSHERPPETGGVCIHNVGEVGLLP